MNKITIPALLVATVIVAGAFAFMPVDQASTVHLNTLAGSYEIKRIQAVDISNGNALFSCDDDGDDGSITFTLDGTTDAAALVALIIDTDEATDAGDTLTIDINADGIEVSAGAVLDAAPAGDTEILSEFDVAGTADPTGNIGPIGFTNTLVVDVGCEFDNGDLDYQVFAFFEAPDAAVITPTESVV